MLTDQDVEKIIEAEKEVFATKENLAAFQEEMRKNFSSVLTGIDNYAAKADTYFQEMVMLAHKVDRLERWIKEVASKIGIKLDS